MAPWWLRTSSDDDEGSTEPTATPKEEASEEKPRSEARTEPDTARDEAARDQKAVEDAEPEAEKAKRREVEAAPSAETSVDDGDEASSEEDDTGSRSPRKRRRRRRRKASHLYADFTELDTEDGKDEDPAAQAAPKEDDRADLEALAKGIVYAMPEIQGSADERKIAIFCDLENIALGVRDSDIKQLDVNLILGRLLEKGKIIAKKAYADWERFQEYKRAFHEAAIELIDIPQKYYSGKNSADIKMVVDAMDLCYSKEHLDTFVIVSGDSDFSPLVSKLKENDKYVIGVGVKNSSSNLLIANCDEFIYYEDVWRDSQRAPRLENLPPKSAEVFKLMTDAMIALRRENKEVLWGSMIKQTMKRKRPSFNEGYYGFGSFSQLLEDAERRKIIRLQRDQGSGNYIVTWFAEQK